MQIDMHLRIIFFKTTQMAVAGYEPRCDSLIFLKFIVKSKHISKQPSDNICEGCYLNLKQNYSNLHYFLTALRFIFCYLFLKIRLISYGSFTYSPLFYACSHSGCLFGLTFNVWYVSYSTYPGLAWGGFLTFCLAV